MRDEKQGRGIMADRFDLDAIDADDALLDLLAAGGESARSAGEHDPAVRMLAELRLAVEVEDELPEEKIDDPESFLARCAALNPVMDPFARKVATRGLALGVAAVAALSVSGVAAAVNGDPLSPYEKVIEKVVDAVTPQTSFPKEQLDGMPVVDKTKIIKVAKDFQRKQAEKEDAEQKAIDAQPDPPAAVVAKDVTPDALQRVLPQIEQPTATKLDDPPPVQPTQVPDQTNDTKASDESTDKVTTDDPTSDPTGEPTDAPATTTTPETPPTDPPATTTPPETPPTTPEGGQPSTGETETGDPTTAPGDGAGNTGDTGNTGETGSQNGSSGETGNTGETGSENGSTGETGGSSTDQSGTDQSGTDQSGTDQSDSGQTGSDKSGSGQTDSDQTGGGLTGSSESGIKQSGDQQRGDDTQQAAPVDPQGAMDSLAKVITPVLPTPTGQPIQLQSAKEFFPAKHSSGKVVTGSVRKTYSKGKHSTGQYPEGKHAAIARTHGSTADANVLKILGVVNKPTK
jgi:hypothetical protein